MAAKKRVVAAKKRVVAAKRTSPAAARVTKARPAPARTAAQAASGTKRASSAAAPAKRGTSSSAPAKAKQVAAASSSAGAADVGAPAPAFELSDQRGEIVSSAALTGQPYVLYFYPKNDTPGCTTEACGFRDAFSNFERLGVRVVGVSPDGVNSHRKFADKYGLPFTLLSDAEQELASKYGVWALKKNYGREYMGIVRSTFLIDGAGIVRKAWRGVRVSGHVPEVAAAAAEVARA